MFSALLLGGSSLAPAHSDEYYHYRGAIHVHTRYSDGSGSFAKVARAAQAASLDYLITTDHNTLQPLLDGQERYWGHTLVLVGTEISTDAGHCLALDLPASFRWDTLDAQTVIDEVNHAGGFAILAHPEARSWRWTNWDVRGYAGIEIINLAGLVDDDIRTASYLRIGGRSFDRVLQLSERYLANHGSVLRRLTESEVQPERVRWDELLKQGQPVVGIASVDAHARIPLRGKVLRAPSYQDAFESVQTYVLTPAPLSGQLAADRQAIYSAYRSGRLYLVYPRIAPAPQFQFRATEGAQEATMGQPIRLDREVCLTVEAPGHAQPLIRLLRDGAEVAHTVGTKLEWRTAVPGVYRAEVYVKSGPKHGVELRPGVYHDRVEVRLQRRPRALRPWIFSNPIYVTGSNHEWITAEAKSGGPS
jgi:hypothetical protein